MDPKGPFLQQGIRIYAIARDGMILADGKRPYNVGKNGFFFTDRYGGSMSRFTVMIGTTDNSGYMLSLHNADNGGIRVVLQYIRWRTAGTGLLVRPLSWARLQRRRNFSIFFISWFV